MSTRMTSNNSPKTNDDIIPDPSGSCCFFIPLRQGAATIVAIFGILSCINAIMHVNSKDWDFGQNLLYAFIAFISAYYINKGKYVVALIYGFLTLVSTMINFAIVIISIDSTQFTYEDGSLMELEDSRSLKLKMSVKSILLVIPFLYFEYVIIEYGFKARMIAQAAKDMDIPLRA